MCEDLSTEALLDAHIEEFPFDTDKFLSQWVASVYDHGVFDSLTLSLKVNFDVMNNGAHHDSLRTVSALSKNPDTTSCKMFLH